MNVEIVVGVMYIVWIIIIVRDHIVKEKTEPGDHEKLPPFRT